MYFLLSRSLPDYDATTEVQGLITEIEIVRDTGNVPHILGTTNADTMFGRAIPLMLLDQKQNRC